MGAAIALLAFLALTLGGCAAINAADSWAGVGE